jgi:preprotein translocase subunit SecA
MLGSSTRQLLDQLGMSDSEPLTHSMIGGALRRAQEQIEKKKAKIETYARSSAEWMQLNMSE